MIARQALAIRLLDLGDILHDLLGKVRQRRIQPVKILLLEARLRLLFGRGDLIPGIPIGRFPLRIRRHLGLELGFIGALGIHHALVLQALCSGRRTPSANSPG